MGNENSTPDNSRPWDQNSTRDNFSYNSFIHMVRTTWDSWTFYERMRFGEELRERFGKELRERFGSASDLPLDNISLKKWRELSDEERRLVEYGFGPDGPIKGSQAARDQSNIGNVPKNHPFCDKQRQGQKLDIKEDSSGMSGWSQLAIGVGVVAAGAAAYSMYNETKPKPKKENK